MTSYHVTFEPADVHVFKDAAQAKQAWKQASAETSTGLLSYGVEVQPLSTGGVMLAVVNRDHRLMGWLAVKEA